MAAAAAALGGVESLAKSVEELSAAARSPPKKYILKDGIGGADFPAMDVVVINVALLTSSSPEGEKEVGKLGLAMSNCGYIQAVNHGIEESLDEMRSMTKEFFSLPKEEKMKCARPEDDIDGYGNDTVFSDKQTLDWNDRLYLVVIPESARKLKVWPQNPPNFRKALVDLTKKMEKLVEQLKAMARYLKVEDEEWFFEDARGESVGALEIQLLSAVPATGRRAGGEGSQRRLRRVVSVVGRRSGRSSGYERWRVVQSSYRP